MNVLGRGCVPASAEARAAVASTRLARISAL